MDPRKARALTAPHPKTRREPQYHPAKRPWYARILTDLGPARRSPAYRRLLIGQVISQSGTQLTVVALPVQVFAITGSSFSVGLLGLVSFVPLLIGGLYGGAIADSMDRRKLAMLTSIGLAATSGLLVLQAVTHLHAVAVLYVLAGVQALLAGVDSPARTAIIPRLVPVADLPAAGALSYAGHHAGDDRRAPRRRPARRRARASGSRTGSTPSASRRRSSAVFRLPSLPPEGGGTKAGSASVLEGLRFLRTQPVVTMTFAVDLVAMIFGMPRALFPALAAHRFGGGARTVGYLYTALAAGGLVGTVFGGWFSRIKRQGLAVLVAVAVWGAAVVGFGLVDSLIPALLVLARRRRGRCHQRGLPGRHPADRDPGRHARAAAGRLHRRRRRRPAPRRPRVRRCGVARSACNGPSSAAASPSSSASLCWRQPCRASVATSRTCVRGARRTRRARPAPRSSPNQGP